MFLSDATLTKMMNKDHCVIIGGSHAGASLAANLRQAGWRDAISIVSAEPFLPYQRPPLSKGYLSSGVHIDEMLIRPAAFYQKADIDLVLGTAVTAIDRKDKKVYLHDGGVIPYTKLALATGARVRTLNVPGYGLDGVLYLRDINHADKIRHYVGHGKSAVIVGGGYVGLETAASLRKVQMQVTVLEAQPRILQRVTVPEISAFYARVHREEGVQIIPNATLASINGKTAVESVTCADGTTIKADLVIIGIGVVPATDLAKDAGLEVDNGIIVDEYARTSDKDIVAAGDCTHHFNDIYGRKVRLESVQNATDQAKVAAHTICGRLEPYRSVPWFWSDQYDLKLQIAGLSDGFDKVVYRGSLSSGRSFAAFYFKQQRLLAVDAVNRPREFMAARRALAEGRMGEPYIIADESRDIQHAFYDLH